MMAQDDLDIHRNDPFDDEAERQSLRRAAYRADQTWLISRPIVAIVSNWKALVIALVVIAWLNRPEIMEALQVIAGVAK